MRMVWASITVVLIGVVGIEQSYSEELWFDAHFEFFNEQNQEDREFRLGETVYAVGSSSFYKEATDKHIPSPDTEFHVTIKNPKNTIIHEQSYFSDSQGNIEFSFPISNDYHVGEYLVEMIVDERKHLDLSFFVGHTEGDVVKIEEEFDLWMEDSEIISTLDTNVVGVLCSDHLKKSTDRKSVFLDPYDEFVLNEHSVNFKAYFTDPNGNEFLTSSNPEKDSCTNFALSTTSTDTSGEWSVYVTGLWMADEILYEATSHPISFHVKESLFKGTIEKIPVPKAWYNVHVQDWSGDGKSTLLTYSQPVDADSSLPQIAVMSVDDFQITKLNIPMFLEADTHVDLAKFSPDGKFIHFVADDGNLLQYNIETADVTKLTTFPDWIHFDYYHYDDNDPSKYSIVVSVNRDAYYGNTSETGIVLLDIGNGDENSIDTAHELISGVDLNSFDISPDGKKILFHKTIESGYGWANRVLAYYTPQGDVVEIPNSQVKCGDPSKWTPNGEMILYNLSSCGRGAPGSTLHLISTDGAYQELILPYDNLNPDSFAISPEGTSLFYVKDSNFEMMTLAKAVPEFQTIAMFILMLSILPMILLQKQFVLK